MPYRLFADAILLLHLGVVLFVVGSLIAIFIGALRGWSWVKNPWFRAAHLVAIAFIVIQSWLGAVCPLTTLESWLRTQAGEAGYARGFIEHWIQGILFYEAPAWIFTLAYTLFGLAVLAAWRYCRPFTFADWRRRHT